MQPRWRRGDSFYRKKYPLIWYVHYVLATHTTPTSHRSLDPYMVAQIMDRKMTNLNLTLNQGADKIRLRYNTTKDKYLKTAQVCDNRGNKRMRYETLNQCIYEFAFNF